MPSYNTEVIVTSARRYGEADRLLILFSKDRGRFSAIAKSARKPKSSLRGGSEVFIRATYQLAEGRSLHIVRQIEIIDAHLGIRENWRRLQMAGHVAEIVNKVSVEKIPDPELYGYLANALKGTSDGSDDAVIRFKAEVLNHLGVFPELAGCAACATSRVKGDVHLSNEHHGFLCVDCAKDKGIWHPVPMSVLYLLHGLREGQGDLIDPDLSDDEVKEILEQGDEILTMLIQVFLQHGLKTTGATRHARNSKMKNDKKLAKDADNN